MRRSLGDVSHFRESVYALSQRASHRGFSQPRDRAFSRSGPFMKRLNIEAMHVQQYESLSRDVGPGSITLKNRITPQDNMPGFIKSSSVAASRRNGDASKRDRLGVGGDGSVGDA